MKFTIDRKTWLRGEGGGESYLRRPSDSKMDCFGQRAVACGIDMEALLSRRFPDTVAPEHSKGDWRTLTLRTGLIRTIRIMAINDDQVICDEERERRLKQEFS